MVKNIIIFWAIPLFIIVFWHLRYPLLAILTGILIGFAVQTAALFINYKLKLNYYLIIVLIYILFFFIVGLIIYSILNVLSEEFPTISQQVSTFIKEISEQPQIKKYLKIFKLPEINIKDEWQNLISLIQKYSFFLFDLFSNIISGFLYLPIIIVVSLYTSLDKNLLEKVASIFYKEKLERNLIVLRTIKRKISFWLLGQIILMIFIGFFTYLFVGPILKIEYASLIALTAGFLEVVPILGPAISLFLAALITLIFKPEVILLIIGYFIILQQLENHFLVPLVMRKAISLNPLLTILGILLGYKFGGILGIITMLPILGILVELLKVTKLPKEKKLF